jgi:hypothetical protein
MGLTLEFPLPPRFKTLIRISERRKAPKIEKFTISKIVPKMFILPLFLNLLEQNRLNSLDSTIGETEISKVTFYEASEI